MRKKMLISFIIIICLLIIFGIILILYKEKMDNDISLIEEDKIIEYGNIYNPNIDALIELSKYKYINLEKIRIESNIENEKDKNYPSVGDYEISIYYKKRVLTQKVHVIDTTAPAITIQENIELDYNTDLTTVDFKNYITISDLSNVKDYVIDFSNVDANVSGEYGAVISIEDIYGNKTEKHFKIKILEKVEEIAQEKKEEKVSTETKKDKSKNNNSSSKIINSTKTQETDSINNSNNQKDNNITKKENINTTNNINEEKTDTNNKKTLFCVEGGIQHMLGTGPNEHGYYSTWEAAEEVLKEKMKNSSSGNYYIDQCYCELYYYYLRED